MNLNEYRRELREAFGEYRDAMQIAADRLEKRTLAAEMEFSGENDAKAIYAEENVPHRRRD